MKSTCFHPSKQKRCRYFMRTIASVFSDVRQATSLSGYSLHTKQSGQGHVGCGNTMSEETIKEGFTALCYTSIDLSKQGWASMICGFLFLLQATSLSCHSLQLHTVPNC